MTEKKITLTKVKIEKAPTGQPYTFPNESLTQNMGRVNRTPIGIKTATKYNAENSVPNQTQAYESKFRKI